MATDNADIESKVLKQVEFYFSDSNLPRDKFLLEQTRQNAEGWVPISVVASFKRMQSITKDLATVVAALKKSSDLLEVKEDAGSAFVRRRVVVPENLPEVSKKRTIYAKRFPDDATIDSVMEFFKPHGNVLSVRLRHWIDKDKQRRFKGSVFVEFATPEEAEAVVAKKLQHDGKDLILMTHAGYFESKKNELKGGNKKRKNGSEAKGDANDDDEDEEEAGDNAAPAAAAAPEYTKNVILRFDELKDASREDLKAALEAAGYKVAYVDFSRGQTEGFVRLETPSASEAASKLADANVQIKGQPAKTRALEGDEEKEYYAKVDAIKKSKRGANKGKKFGGKKGKGNGKGKPKEKKQKTDDDS